MLKGANTIVAGPDGATRISPVATAALATAGTGDVLAGAIGGLIGQGLTPFDAASLAVYLHGDAGIRSVRGHGNAGTTASDVLAQLALAGRSLAGEEPLEGPAGGFGGGFGAGLGGEPGGKGLEGLLGQPGGLGAPEGA